LFPFQTETDIAVGPPTTAESKGLTVSALVGAIECVFTRMQLLIHRLEKTSLIQHDPGSESEL